MLQVHVTHECVVVKDTPSKVGNVGGGGGTGESRIVESSIQYDPLARLAVCRSHAKFVKERHHYWHRIGRWKGGWSSSRLSVILTKHS